jgi:hypothetical protein
MTRQVTSDQWVDKDHQEVNRSGMRKKAWDSYGQLDRKVQKTMRKVKSRFRQPRRWFNRERLGDGKSKW